MSFFFPSRIARLSYLFRALLFGAATCPLSAMLNEESTASSLKVVGLLLLAVASIGYWLVYIIRPRCKDAGMGWGWIFLVFVPLVNVGFSLILLFSRSKPSLDEEKPSQAPELGSGGVADLRP